MSTVSTKRRIFNVLTLKAGKVYQDTLNSIKSILDVLKVNLFTPVSNAGKEVLNYPFTLISVFLAPLNPWIFPTVLLVEAGKAYLKYYFNTMLTTVKKLDDALINNLTRIDKKIITLDTRLTGIESHSIKSNKSGMI